MTNSILQGVISWGQTCGREETFSDRTKINKYRFKNSMVPEVLCSLTKLKREQKTKLEFTMNYS